MNEYNPDPAAKKVKYIASIVYLLVLAFIVGGSYINQQLQESSVNEIDDYYTVSDGVVVPDKSVVPDF